MQPAAEKAAQSTPITLWLSPLAVEIEPLLYLLDATASADPTERPGWRATLRGQEIHAFLCGVGGEACERALTDLLSRWPDARVLLVGLGGALNPSLAVGDVVVASRALSWPPHDKFEPRQQPLLGATGETLASGCAPLRAAGAGFRVVPGCILSWDGLVNDGSLKEHLHDCYGADCVDMETGYAARVCRARGVPFLAVRGISDQADGTIDDLKPADLAQAAWHATLVALKTLTWDEGWLNGLGVVRGRDPGTPARKVDQGQVQRADPNR